MKQGIYLVVIVTLFASAQAQSYLDKHNDIRASKFGQNALSVDSTLANEAQRLNDDSTCEFVHLDSQLGGEVGENLWLGFGSNRPTGDAAFDLATDAWLGEEAAFDAANVCGSYRGEAEGEGVFGHFAQIVNSFAGAIGCHSCENPINFNSDTMQNEVVEGVLVRCLYDGALILERSHC